MSYAYYNGYFGRFKEISIPLTDRSVFFGDGVYDAAIGRDEEIYLADEHIERFIGNARAVGLPFNMTESELKDLLYSTVKRSKIKSFFLYFQLSGHADERMHAPRDHERSNLLITVKRHELPPPDRELVLSSFTDIRQGFCNIKTLNLLGSVMSAESAISRGSDEAVLVRDGTVTECSHSNIFIISSGVLRTHPECTRILPGIMRKRTIMAAKRLGIPVEEAPFTYDEMIGADDVLISSTSKLLLRAKSVDGVKFTGEDRDVGDKLIEDMRKDYENPS